MKFKNKSLKMNKNYQTTRIPESIWLFKESILVQRFESLWKERITME